LLLHECLIVEPPDFSLQILCTLLQGRTAMSGLRPGLL